VSVKTNERPGTRAVLRYCRLSSYKVREVLDLIRGVELSRALELLDHTDRAAAAVVAKLVRSAAANAEHNEGLDPEELFIVSAFADEGTTLKRWRPRARGRATRIRKRTCHITIVLARMPEDKLARRRARVAAEATARRARRVAGTRRQAAPANEAPPSATAAGAGASTSDQDIDEVDDAGVFEPDALDEDATEVTADDAADDVESGADDAATDADASGEDAD
jgi:large subunit ribosomal protein L22